MTSTQQTKIKERSEYNLTPFDRLIANRKSNSKLLYLFLKRILDVIFASIAIVILLPLFLIISVAVRIDSPGTILYKHERIGKGGKKIKVYKFRSMYQNSEELMDKLLKDSKIRKEWYSKFKLKDDTRVTRIGKFLRRTSLDELPQLFNILKGDMSIIGPRPIVSEELEKYGDFKEKLLSVKPGLTGWWTCNRREDMSYEERMSLELYYIDNLSFYLDIKCFFKTVNLLFKREGINNEK